MTYTQSYSRTSTYIYSRARVVMNKALDDIIGLCAIGFITKDTALKWYEDILYVLSKEAADFFEIQLISSSLKQCGIRYEVSDNGYIYEDSESGGIDYYGLHNDTQVSLFLKLRTNSPNYYEVLQELENNRGWGTNGKALENSIVGDRAYSKDGYGLVRNKVGQW